MPDETVVQMNESQFDLLRADFAAALRQGLRVSAALDGVLGKLGELDAFGELDALADVVSGLLNSCRSRLIELEVRLIELEVRLAVLEQPEVRVGRSGEGGR